MLRLRAIQHERTLSAMQIASASAAMLFMLLSLPAWAGKLVYAPPPPVLLDEQPEKSTEPRQPALSEASSRGRLLYENHCTGCHESVVHVREDRQVKSLAGLQAQVARWSSYQNLHWRKEDVEDVARYLNERYYHQ